MADNKPTAPTDNSPKPMTWVADMRIPETITWGDLRALVALAEQHADDEAVEIINNEQYGFPEAVRVMITVPGALRGERP